MELEHCEVHHHQPVKLSFEGTLDTTSLCAKSAEAVVVVGQPMATALLTNAIGQGPGVH